MKGSRLYLFRLMLIMFSFYSCTQIEINTPAGPKVEQGIKGDTGMSTYDLWKLYTVPQSLDQN